MISLELLQGNLHQTCIIPTVCFCFQCKREGYIQKVKDEEGEGCNMHGSLEVNKVAGSFHFATGKSFLQSPIFLIDLLAVQDNHNVRLR